MLSVTQLELCAGVETECTAAHNQLPARHYLAVPRYAIRASKPAEACACTASVQLLGHKGYKARKRQSAANTELSQTSKVSAPHLSPSTCLPKQARSYLKQP